jgi:hypothetical protein
MKVVIWNGIGRFEGWMVSSLALERMRELCVEKHVKMPPHHQIISCRHDPVFVQAVEELGEKAVKCAGDELSVVDLGLNNKGYKIISISGEGTHRKEIVVTPNDTDWVSTDMFATKPSMVNLACDLAFDWDNEGKFELYDHKAGFKFTLPNGNVVSVAWLPGCDCERRYHAWRQGEEPCAPKGYDSKDAEVLIQGPDGERHYFKDFCESVSGWQSPEQVRELIKWASENAVVPRAKAEWEMEDEGVSA